MSEQHTAPPTEPNPDHLLLTPAAAPIIGLKPQSLRARRLRGGGPPYVRVAANRVAYKYSELVKFRDAHTFTSTAEEHANGPKPAA